MMEIKVDPDRLTVGDLEIFERAQHDGVTISDLVGILSRLTGTDETVIRGLNVAQFRELITQVTEAVRGIGIQGEASGGNSTDTSGRVRGRRHSST